MKKLFCIIILASAFILLLTAVISADSEVGPHPYKKVVCNDKYVFVMNPTQDPGFPSAGLYENNGGMRKIWDADWYAHEGGIYLTNDGEYAAALGPWARLYDDKKSRFQQLAVAFYKNGKLVKSYSIGDLVQDDNKIEKTVSHFFWSREVKYNDISSILKIKTLDNQTYEFDLRTAKIKTAVDYYYIVVVLLVIAGILLLLFLKYRQGNIKNISARQDN